MVQRVPAIAGLPPWAAADTHLAQRVRYIVALAMRMPAEHAQPELSQVLDQRLRGVGVSLATRQIQQLAEVVMLLRQLPRVHR